MLNRRDFAGLVWVPSEIWADGDMLRWRNPGVSSHDNWSKPDVAALLAFCELSDAAPEKIARYAKKWGVFGAAKLREGAPKSEAELPFGTERWITGVGRHTSEENAAEPILLWRSIAREFTAIMNIGIELNALPPRVGHGEDWETVNPDGAPLDAVEDAQFFLDILVNDWLTRGRVRLMAQVKEWSKLETRWDLVVHYGRSRGIEYNLLGALAFQMFLAVANADAVYSCSGCKQLYKRDRYVNTTRGRRKRRRPKPEQNNYCQACGVTRALLDADRRRKRAMADAKRMARGGLSPEGIATALGKKVSMIRRWVKGVKHVKTEGR